MKIEFKFAKVCVASFTCLSLIVGALWTTPLSAQLDDFSVSAQEKTLENESIGIHGLFSTTFTNDYITPRGLLFTNSDLMIQVLYGFGLNVYKNPKGCINDVTFTAATFSDFWTGQDSPTAGAWLEFDWGFGATVVFAKHWTFGVQYVQFLSPSAFFRMINNVEFLLAFNDSYLKLPLAFNPYVKLWWSVSGESCVAVGRRGHTYDVEIGFVPTYILKTCQVPVTFTFPTWVTVGPESFWNGGKFALKHENSNFGVFSTGLMAQVPLKFIPKKFGKWYANAGTQYYYLINKNLLEAQRYTIGVHSYKDAHRNIVTGYLTIGVNW